MDSNEIERGLTMRCSEPLRTSQSVLPSAFASATCAHARAAPASAVAELGSLSHSPTTPDYVYET